VLRETAKDVKRKKKGSSLKDVETSVRNLSTSLQELLQGAVQIEGPQIHQEAKSDIEGLELMQEAEDPTEREDLEIMSQATGHEVKPSDIRLEGKEEVTLKTMMDNVKK
jgi:hypothetical protein